MSTHNRFTVLAEPHNNSTEVLLDNYSESCTNLDVSDLVVKIIINKGR